LINILGQLAKHSGIEVIIPKGVEEEAVEKPITIKRFELSALRILKGIKDGWIKVFERDKALEEEVALIQSMANSIYSIKGKPVEIVQKGEAETIALAKILGARVVAIDERTTRLIIENALNLKKFMAYKYKENVKMDQKNLIAFNELAPRLQVIRSTELIALAYDKKLFSPELNQTPKDLEAALFAMKYAGCAISFEEIQSFLKKK
jgi:predicted nucleic acid-binding protein